MKPKFKNYIENPFSSFKERDRFLKELKGKAFIDKTARIREPVVIDGPCYIGPGCVIGPFSFIREGTYLEGDNRVGNSEIKNSIILKGTNIPHYNYVGDSIIGRNCNLGAGAKVANLKLNEKPVKMMGRDTGLRKLGVIMGDNVKAGINVLLYPGEVIPSNTFIFVDLKTGKRILKRRDK